MTRFFLKTKVSRPISFTLLLLFVSEIIFPTASMALTSGPSQPEVLSFEPVSTSDMVDVFSGDFKYNIPLLDVEGYPINIAYASGISTDQEASWVGLGWNLNVGNVNRAMRGLPDDFKGDLIHKETNMKPNRSFGINAGIDFEIFGKEGNKKPGGKVGKKFKLKPSVGVAINYNNYTGFGVDLSIGTGISAGVSGKGLDAGLGLHSNAASGLDITPALAFSVKKAKADQKDNTLTHVNSMSGSLSGAFNTRAGLKQLSFNGNYTKSVEKSSLGVYYNPVSAVPGVPTIDITEEVSTISSKGRSAGATVNFGLQSYVPNIAMPMINNAVDLSVKFSTHIFGIDADVRLGGFYSSQQLAEKTKDVPSYGYMYSELANGNSGAMLDFNREKESSFSRTTKNLPITNFTYDVYNVTGQGMGGTFRPYRSDVGHVFDVSSGSISDSYSLGAELGGGNLLKVGVDVSVTDVTSNTGKWTDDNEALDYFQFNQASLNSTFEPYYFKAVGELSQNTDTKRLYTDMGGDQAYGINIQQGSSNSAALNSNLPNMKSKKKLEQFPYDSSPLVLATGTNKITQRQKRNQCFTTLTKDEAKNFGLQKDLYNTVGVKDHKNNTGSEMKISASSQNHHIAEISVINTNGQRYYYGLPAYNIKTQEYSFNIAGELMNGTTGLVNYNAGDITTGNNRGVDGHYNMTETPPYAYTYLLTAIVSADYVDINGNGPDNADIGTYTKFHYKKSSASGDYKWRMPIDATAGMANFSENSKSNPLDNSASFTYGEKELWYLDEIETKNYLAKFTLSDRNDAVGVSTSDGTIPNQAAVTTTSKKIDKIDLYSKPEYDISAANAVPIKTVYFVYDYSLCSMASGRLPNNRYTTDGGGKLTLKQVYFTYGKSNRAILNKYQFTYASNPNYHNKAYDRWGNYKPVTGSINYGVTQAITNPEFPYVEQNKTNADTYAQAWNLSKISLPSGGEINIEYESDDYAFVQNMPAGQMFKVLGFTTNNPGNDGTAINWTNELYTSGNGTSKLYMVVDLQNMSPVINNDNDFVKYCLKDINEYNKQLFFKFLVNLTKPAITNNPDFYEFVSGYVDVVYDQAQGKALAGIIKDPANGNAPTGKAWIKLKDVSLKNKGNGPNINPIAMSAIQFARLNYGSQIWGAPFSPPGDIEDALKQLAQAAAGSAKTLVTGFKNPNKALYDKEFCRTFQASKSMVRLYNPNGKQLGGGCRVKKLYLDDKWNIMTAPASPVQSASQYGQLYTYETTDDFGRTISSGVASYEPLVGSEENSMKQPSYMGKNKWAMLAPDDRYYVEGPFGESFYPSASVGYSKIKVSAFISNANATQSSKDGYKVYEFYTAKDYPTLTKHTPIMPKQFRSPLKSLVKIFSRDLVSASQGYVVITNDMHGKPKAEYDYSATNDIVSETHFYYKSKSGYHEPSQINLYGDASYSGNELDNSCTVITKDGNIATEPAFGVDFDAIADFRESETQTNMVGAQINVSSFLVGLVPVLAASMWPKAQFEQSRFRSSVLTKVVNKYGILEKTVVKVDKSVTTAESMAFDAETGDVLVSKTTNDYDDPIYNVKYPAHWGYDQMGGSYKNIGLTFQAVSPGNGLYTVGNLGSALSVGDELMLSINNGPFNQKVWVCSKSGASIIGLIDQAGSPVLYASVKLKVLRSGRRNLYGSQMSVLTCLNNPISGSALTINSASNVLDAKGVEYSDRWQIPKGFGNAIQQNNCSCTITQTGTDLINTLKSLFNTPCNSNGSPGSPSQIPGNAFFNGGSAPSPLPTALWLAPGAQIPPGGGNYAFSLINTGFGTPSIYPNYNNYSFTQNLLNLMPYLPYSTYNPGINGQAPYIGWVGPVIYNSNVFGSNTGNVFSGYFFTDNGGCNIKFEFPNLTPSDNTLLNGYFNQLSANTGAAPSNTVIDLVPVSGQSYCDASQIKVNFMVKVNGSTVYQNNQVIIKADCLAGNLLSCPGGPPANPGQCGLLENNKINPFFYGIKGNWRSKTNYVYLTDRVQTISSGANGTNTNARKDGYYTGFSQLFSAAGGNDWSFNPGSGVNKWVSSVQTTRYNQLGVEIETKDALGRYSSALYGYNDALPVAVAANARLQEIAFDGFEDYDYYPAVCNREHHFDFYSIGTRNTSEAHSGKYSLQLAASTTLSQSKTVVNSLCNSTPAATCYYYLGCGDLIYPFTPVSVNSGNTATDYIISYWVKENYSGAKPLDYSGNQVTVTQGAGAAFATKNLKKSAIIDGWQRVEYTYTIPNNYSGALAVNLVNSGSNTVYFDDIRMHPAAASMKTFVYHPVTLKYVAELDANNFATFFEYDAQGNLIRTKKETERGIMTIKESKTHYAN